MVKTSLVAQTVKCLPTMRETRVRSLGREDPLQEGMATHSNILACRIPMDRGAWQTTVHGVTKSRTRLRNEFIHFHLPIHCCLNPNTSYSCYSGLVDLKAPRKHRAASAPGRGSLGQPSLLLLGALAGRDPTSRCLLEWAAGWEEVYQ